MNVHDHGWACEPGGPRQAPDESRAAETGQPAETGRSADSVGRSADSVGQVIRRARRTWQWPQSRLIYEMRLIARQRGIRLPCDESLKSMVSRWENDRQVPDEFNRSLLCAALQIPTSAIDHEPD